MAKYISLNVGRSNCGLRTVPQYGLWMWLILINVLDFPCVFSMCQNSSEITVAVIPTGSIKVRYGQPLEIFCVTENFSSQDLEFAINGNALPYEIVNSTTIRYYEKRPEKQVTTLYCRNKQNNKKCVTRVVVDSPPMNVTDFSCISKNLEVLNCTWSYNTVVSTPEFKLKYYFNRNSVDPCNATKSDNINYCTWTTFSKPRYQQLEETYYFNLNSCNFFGCISQNFTIDHFSIVKPDPPTNLKAISNNTHSVMLQWNIPINMVNLLSVGVDHRIEYQIAKIDNTSYFRRVDTSSLPPQNRTYKFLLSDLPYAHMQYEVRIYIKTKTATKEEFWSDFTYFVFYTASEKPHRPPDTIIGSFDQSSFEKKRRINVYWKQLEEYEECGPNFTYKVVTTQPNRNPQTLYADKNKSMSHVVLENASLDAINVSLWSVNDKGSSNDSSYLYIPPYKDTENLKVSSFTMLAYENGTYKLSWIGLKNIDSYTLFWCQHNITQICAGQINFKFLDSNSSVHVIDLPRASRYQFAISGNNGTKTSGMVWALCDISKDGIPMYGYPIKVNHDPTNKTFVMIRWRMDCTLQEGIITGFIISYCPVLDFSNECATKNKLFINITDPTIMEKNITGLEPYTTYLFTLALKTTYGEKSIENASTRVTTLEDTPTAPVNVKIKNLKHNSLDISWDPPLHKNGIIGKYVINNFGKEYKSIDVIDKNITRQYLHITGLQGFTNYSWTIQACNVGIKRCSKINPAETYNLRTPIGPPGIMKAPMISSNPDMLSWKPPEIHAGTVDLYEIKRLRDDNKSYDIIETPNQYYSLVFCEGGAASENYQIRAINFDEDKFHGATTDKKEIDLPARKPGDPTKYFGEWSSASTVTCRGRDGLTMTLILMAIFALIGIMYGSIKCYKKYRKMEDIKPVLPNGLGIPEKDISKYTFGGWNPSTKDEKPSSDEMLLLPNSRSVISPPEVKEKNSDKCTSSDHTDSTAISETSRGPIDRQISTSDDGSNSSLHLEIETQRGGDISDNHHEEESSISGSEVSQESSPYFSNKVFKENLISGYVQQPVINNAAEYVQSAPNSMINPPIPAPTSNASSSYVMAALSPPIFTTGVMPLSVTSNPSSTSEYMHSYDSQPRSPMAVSKLGSSPTKLFGPESLPSMPTLPMPAKHGTDNSYIQLQSLDSLPSHKQPLRNTVPLKPPTSSGYVSPGDAVINKHINNMLSGGQLAEESAILDPAMSPDAYCRFSWSTDPANDNLHSLLADSSRLNSSIN